MRSALTQDIPDLEDNPGVDAADNPAVDRAITVRKATMRDIPGLLALINGYAADGVMLGRTEFELCENMRDFAIALDGEKLVGCGALHFYSPVVGEIRSLAVAPELKTRGVGRSLIRYLVREAREYRLGAVFAFTYVPGFFDRVGFHEVERGLLPLKVWKDCLRCPKFQSCDETAVLRVLDEERWGSIAIPQFDPSLFVQLPNIKK
jgi:amino-acid N-acetyltransferase